MNQTVMLTDASSEIGKATAALFAKQGWKCNRNNASERLSEALSLADEC